MVINKGLLILLDLIPDTLPHLQVVIDAYKSMLRGNEISHDNWMKIRDNAWHEAADIAYLVALSEKGIL